MGVVTHENEVVTKVPPAKMFKIFVLDAPNFIPKILPTCKSVETVEGNGGPGTIRKTTFAEGHEFKYVMHKTEVLDKDNVLHKYSVNEGDPWMDTLGKISCETKMMPSPDGGSICKSIVKYHPKGDNKIYGDKIKDGEEKALELFKAVEAYILANPHACD